jgi:lincosamide nucleotidyltransferase A/C/D/E
VQSSQVVELFRTFADADVRVWLAGGWAVDATVGRQTRVHGDVDLAVDDRDLRSLLGLLHERGFVVTTDWSPSRLELTAADGRVVDIHPVTFGEDGSGHQAAPDGDGFHYSADGFATGRIEGLSIPCLSVEQQLRFRTGYAPRQVDLHDIRLLEEARADPRVSDRNP